MTGTLFKAQGQEQSGFGLKNGQYGTFKIPGSRSFLAFGINDKGDVTGQYNTSFTQDSGAIQASSASFIRRPK